MIFCISVVWILTSFSLLIFLDLHIFNWRIIALQFCVGFYQTSTWISHRFTYVPSHLSPHPTSLGCYRVQVWVSPLSHTFPLTVYFTYSSVCFYVTLSGPSPYFSLVSLAKCLLILFYLFKDLILSFIYLFCCFFLYFCSDHFDFFPSINFGFCLAFFPTCLRCKFRLFEVFLFF